MAGVGVKRDRETFKPRHSGNDRHLGRLEADDTKATAVTEEDDL